MLETTNFVLSTPQGGAAELSQEQYRCLTEVGGLSTRQRSAITMAAQIISHLTEAEPVSFPDLLELVYGKAGTRPTSIDLQARDALLRAGLIRKLGGGWTTRYSLPGS